MVAEIISVGTELLLGSTVDTDSAYLGRTLAGLGIDLFFKQTVGDNLERAKDLILWLEKNDKLWAQSGQVPARLDAQKDPDVQSIWSVKAFAEEFTSVGRPDVPHVAASEIQTTWEQAVSGALAKTTPVKDALTEGSKALQAILDRSS